LQNVDDIDLFEEWLEEFSEALMESDSYLDGFVKQKEELRGIIS